MQVEDTIYIPQGLSGLRNFIRSMVIWNSDMNQTKCDITCIIHGHGWSLLCHKSSFITNSPAVRYAHSLVHRNSVIGPRWSTLGFWPSVFELSTITSLEWTQISYCEGFLLEPISVIWSSNSCETDIGERDTSMPAFPVFGGRLIGWLLYILLFTQSTN